MRKNKPKVSTKNKESDKKIIRILNIMRDYPEGILPKTLSRITGINRNTIKSILLKLKKEGVLETKKEFKGFYYLVENTTHSIFSYNMHNVVITFSSKRIDINERVAETNSLNELIQFRFEIGKKSQKATMHISSNYPYNLTSLSILAHLFQEKVERYCGISPSLEEIMLASIEINRDYYSCKLEKIRCITLDTAISQFKLYEKNKRIREEFKIKVPTEFSFILKLLQQGMISSEIISRIQKQDKLIYEINETNRELKKINQMLWRKIKC